MSDETRARRSYGFWLAVALMLALVLYTLSVGPAVYLVERTGTGLEAARTVYAPLVWLANVSPEARQLLGKYERLWADMAR
jgi:hypothetical protein